MSPKELADFLISLDISQQLATISGLAYILSKSAPSKEISDHLECIRMHVEKILESVSNLKADKNEVATAHQPPGQA